MGGFGVLGLWVMLALTLVGAVAVALGFVWLSNRTLGENVGPAHNPSLSPFLTVVGLVFGALLGFTVVVAWEQFSSAEANVAHEASTLTTMYRQTVAMPDPQRTQLRQQLRRYAEAVSGPEWSARRNRRRHERHGKSRHHRHVSPLRQSRQHVESSRWRVSQSADHIGDRQKSAGLDQEPRIPALLWAGLIFGGVLVIAIAGFVHFSSRRAHVVLASGVALLLGLLLFVVYWLDHPFGTEIGVTPAPFHHAVEVFDFMDRGT